MQISRRKVLQRPDGWVEISIPFISQLNCCDELGSVAFRDLTQRRLKFRDALVLAVQPGETRDLHLCFYPIHQILIQPALKLACTTPRDTYGMASPMHRAVR